MSVWEYKVITSGKGGFATPALMEKFLNDLGKDEWEIVDFHSQPENILAFSGLARRPTQRDWTLADAAATAAKAEAEKLRAEFEAKFKGLSAAPAPVAEEKPETAAAEKAGGDDGLRSLRNTESDQDPDAPEEEMDEWDKLNAMPEQGLPTFFEAMRPHLRRNQRGPGMSVGLDFLAKKWDLGEEDIVGALKECGFEVPDDEEAKPAYVEYDGDLFWVNVNRRGERWINTKEKPRPVFRTVQAAKYVPEETAAEKAGDRSADRRNEPKPEGAENEPAIFVPKPRPESRAEGEAAAPAAPAVPLPEGAAFLEKIRPLMRRNRRGPGGSGSTTFLARALRCSEADLTASFVALGFVVPATGADNPAYVEIGEDVWWLNKDSRGGLWINGREKRDGENLKQEGETPKPETESPKSDGSAVSPAPAVDAAAVATEPAPAMSVPVESPNFPFESASAPTSAPVATEARATNPVLAAVRLLMKPGRNDTVAGKVDRLADELGKPTLEVIETLIATGLKVPDEPKEKPVFVEHAGEIFWFNRNVKDEIWLNAKPSKFSDDGEGKRPSRSRSKKKTEDSGES